MKNFYAQYTDDELWLIKETEWTRHLQGVRESQFTLGNGFIGSRGSLEEVPYDATPGTYMAGVYDKMISQVDELVNLPNPVNFRFTVNGERLGLVAMDTLKHKRFLNMKKGLLARHTLYQNSKKKKFDYKSVRFISMANKNIGVMQIALTPLDESVEVAINTGIDTSIYNAGVLTEGRKKHFRVIGIDQAQNAGYLAVKTLEKRYTILYWSGFSYQVNSGKKIPAKENIFKLKLKKNKTVVFTKVFYINRFSPEGDIARHKQESFKIFSKAFNTNFDTLLKDHVSAWEKLWEKADIVIGGASNLQQNLRFNIYHMVICGNTDDGFSSIGARTLSGEGYRGHIFWDTEIFLLPFYVFTLPETAKNLLLYRYKRIDMARELAKKEGYKGTKYAWESATTGAETTPVWAKDLDGSIIKIYTHKFEHHITADIAYAVDKYYTATGDEKFMREAGYEMMFGSARFWASRVSYNARKKKYEIKNVIGPDEFHTDVNNNAFTNMMAKWNLITARKFYRKVKKESPKTYRNLTKKLELRDREAKEWHKIGARLSININKKGIIEQFDRYFKKKDIIPTKTDENDIPVVSRKLKTEDMEKTQLVKQADVLMLLYLLSHAYLPKTKMVNYEFYAKKTLHKSSLSPAIHSIIACKCGDMHKAYNFFNVSLRMDISNLYGNTGVGIHGASAGGTWQAAISGFAGASIKKERLCVNPRMPRSWRGLVFSLQWKKSLIKLDLTNDTIKLKVISKNKDPMRLGIFNNPVSVKPNKNYTFRRKRSKAL